MNLTEEKRPEIFMDEERKDVAHVGFPEHVAALHGERKDNKFYPYELENLSASENKAITKLMDENNGLPISSAESVSQ